MSTPRLPLSSVYLGRERVTLLGDPRPAVSKILAASGTDPEGLQVRRVQAPEDEEGQVLPLDKVIDRTAQPTVPVYLVIAPAQADRRRPERPRRERFVAFPNPGSPLPRLRGIPPRRTPEHAPRWAAPTRPADRDR